MSKRQAPSNTQTSPSASTQFPRQTRRYELPTLLLHLHQAHEILGLPIPAPIPTTLPLSLRLRKKRRALLNADPTLRYADPTYLYMSLLSRRLRLLPQILTHPTSWPEARHSLRNIKVG